MRLRRCASLMFEPREAVTLDLRAMLAGHAEMDSQISWVALAAHLDQPLPVDAEERQLLGELSAHRWSEPPADASPAMLARLVEQGLLLTDPPSEVGHQMRDEALRRSQWWPLAALAHRHARWQAVDSVDDMRRQGLDTAAGLRHASGRRRRWCSRCRATTSLCRAARGGVRRPAGAPHDLPQLRPAARAAAAAAGPGAAAHADGPRGAEGRA